MSGAPLPARVLRAIEVQRDRGEVLTSWIQGLMVAVFATLYIGAPSTIGEEGRLEYAVIGDAVNRAAKLQNHTRTESVRALTSAAALRTASAQGYVPPRPPGLRGARAVAGVAEPIDLVVLA